MRYFRKAKERGFVDKGWLKAAYSFSFANYFDSRHMGVGALRAINDVVLAPNCGFEEQSHKDMDIITLVLNGTLLHQDSEQNSHMLSPEDVHVISLGSGVTLNQTNYSVNQNVHFIQIWLRPNVQGTRPFSQVISNRLRDGLLPIASTTESGNCLKINLNANIFALRLSRQKHLLETSSFMGYLHIVSGSLTVEGVTLTTGDGFAMEHNESLQISVAEALTALWFELSE